MNQHDLWILGAYALAILGGGPFVALSLKILVRSSDRTEIEEFKSRGLARGGATIGLLERLVVFTVVLAGDYGAIGLILAAKGLIRYGEIKEARNQKVAEYVLIGTMLSIIWAVVVGLAYQRWSP